MSCCAHHEDGSATSDMDCCKGKEGKRAMSCSKAKDGDDAMSCCKGKDGKDAMSCMKGDKDKSANASGSSKKSCGGDGMHGCCSHGG